MATQAYCDAMRSQTRLGLPTIPVNCMWGAIFGYDPQSVAAPGVPDQSLWTVAPVNGQTAQQTVDNIINQQAADQQALDAGLVSSSWWDTVMGGAGNVISTSSWIPVALLGVLAVVVLVPMVSDGGARRYGR